MDTPPSHFRESLGNGGYQPKSVGDALVAARAVLADVSNGSRTDVDNVVLLGELLSDDLVSSTVAQLQAIAGVGRGAGDGAAAGDVVVRQWDNYGVFLNQSVNPVSQVLLQLNGQDRFSRRDGAYFNYVQPWQCHSNTPADGINMFSFALNPEEHQPSGTCNMSRIDNATLNLDFVTATNVYGPAPSSVSVAVSSDAKCNIYATNYNVLRIMSGMAGLAYSN